MEGESGSWGRGAGEEEPLAPAGLRIIPVIDVAHGTVVRAVGGARERYAPIQSPLVEGSDPVTIARALANRAGHQEIYVADLDALAGAEPHWNVHRKLLSAGFSPWLDAGIDSQERADAVRELRRPGAGVHRMLVALESLPSMRLLEQLVQGVGPEGLAFSLDLRGGEPITRCEALRGAAPMTLVEEAVEAGVRAVVVLDLKAVGSRQGPSSLELLGNIRDRFPQIELIAGGGVRGNEDLARLQQAGCNAALVSTWLHAPGSTSRGRDAPPARHR